MLREPGEILAWINRELLEQHMDKHVALFVAVVDMQSDQLHYANAAQFPPAVLIEGDKLHILDQKGKPLGLFDNASWESKTTNFPTGARLVIFSDGVLDLLSGTTLLDKEIELNDLVSQHQSLADLWGCFDARKLGADDVSCLMVSHET